MSKAMMRRISKAVIFVAYVFFGLAIATQIPPYGPILAIVGAVAILLTNPIGPTGGPATSMIYRILIIEPLWVLGGFISCWVYVGFLVAILVLAIYAGGLALYMYQSSLPRARA